MMFSRRAWIFAIFVAVSPAVAGEISGAAHVIDGDTIEIGATKVRLFGIDAPESAQTCRAVVEKAYPCGEAATARVRQMTEGRPITCKGDEHDRYGRLLGVCSVGGVEINRTLVREGLAWAFVKYSRTYVPEEQEARRAKRGVFATENTPPWDFRSGRWGEAEKHALTREGCAIKGNVNRKGEHIYHMPLAARLRQGQHGQGLG